jgi:protein-tyrosine-phosphatase
MQVHFICRGNAYRSLIAEAYLKSLKIPNLDVISSGVVAKEYAKPNIPVIRFTLDYLKLKGLNKYAKTHWDQLTQDRINNEDINVCMNQRVFDERENKVKLPLDTIVWDVDDTGEIEPVPTSDQELLIQTEKIYQKIKDKIDNLAIILQS